MVSAPASHGICNGDWISRFSRCRKKLRFANEGTICRDPKKVVLKKFLIMKIFDFLIMKKIDRSETHSSRPRTYLPSRSGATHALRVQSSLKRANNAIWEAL